AGTLWIVATSAGHLSRADRIERGRKARKTAPRSSHGDWAPAFGRPDPVAVLEKQAATRVPELVPVRYGRMLTSPFAFYRGAAAIMAADLAQTQASGHRVQACGDAHLSNFGIFGTPERKFVFDINDFDETLPAPWEWDVKRLAASVAVAGRESGRSRAQRARAVRATVRAYRRTLAELANTPPLHVWHQPPQGRHLMAERRREFSPKKRAQAEADVAKALTRDHRRAAGKLTKRVGDGRRFANAPPLIVVLEHLLPGESWHEIEAEILAMVES